MVYSIDYVAQAENAIYSKEEDKREEQSQAWMSDVQSELEQQYGYQVPEHQALLLLIKQDKIPMIESNLEDTLKEIEKIEDCLFTLLAKKKQFKRELFEAKEDLSQFDQKLKDAREEHSALEDQAEMEYERFMTVGY